MRLARISLLLLILRVLPTTALGAVSQAPARKTISSVDTGLSLASAQALQRKFQLLAQAPAASGSSTPIVVTDREVNSYLKFYGSTFLPPGVYNPILQIEPGGVQGTAVVNFDQLNGAQSQNNPLGGSLMSLIFKGWQPVRAFARIVPGLGTYTLTFQNVQVGDTQLNDWLVNWLLQTYVESKYKIDLSRPLNLPPHVTRLRLEPGKAIFDRGRSSQR